jgi:hypothetical protein
MEWISYKNQVLKSFRYIAGIAIIWAEFSANVCLEYIHFQVFAFVMH